jgi:uncharacterized membrane protein YcaP (DUF421 family)
VEAKPTILIENGKILKNNLAKELLTVDDLRHALRKNQVDLNQDLQYLRKVLFESDGAITIVRRLSGDRGMERESVPPDVNPVQ